MVESLPSKQMVAGSSPVSAPNCKRAENFGSFVFSAKAPENVRNRQNGPGFLRGRASLL